MTEIDPMTMTWGAEVLSKISELMRSPDCGAMYDPRPALDHAGAPIRGFTKWVARVEGTLPGDYEELMASWKAKGAGIRNPESL